jgi:hypothetical protein
MTVDWSAILTLLSVTVYKAIDHPRLALTQTSAGWCAQPRDMAKCVV